MTDPHANFIAAIVAQPDRDLPRLVYADWLEETATPVGTKTCTACDGDGLSTGPPECRPCRRCNGAGQISDGSGNGHAKRASFIRVQCELAREADPKCQERHKEEIVQPLRPIEPLWKLRPKRTTFRIRRASLPPV